MAAPLTRALSASWTSAASALRASRHGRSLRARNAARKTIEQKVRVERAGRGAVAALHVVGEDFQFGLVVGLGAIAQQERMRRHPGVGLLRPAEHDDLALKDAAAGAVERRFIEFAARAAGRRVIDDDGRVGVLAAAQEIGGGEICLGALAGKTLENAEARERGTQCDRMQ